MKIVTVSPVENFVLSIKLDDGRQGFFDVKPYLCLEAFTPLQRIAEFCQIKNGGYYIEWNCGADLSLDTIEAHLSS
jgi:hypothetical protein